MSRQKKKAQGAILRGSFGDVAVVYERDRHGNVQARPVGFRYNRRSWRYWRAVAIALASMARRRLGR